MSSYKNEFLFCILTYVASFIFISSKVRNNMKIRFFFKNDFTQLKTVKKANSLKNVVKHSG